MYAEKQWLFPYISLVLGKFAKLRKVIISFLMCVRPSVRMEKLGSNWADFNEIWYLNIFRKTAEKNIQVSLKSDKI